MTRTATPLLTLALVPCFCLFGVGCQRSMNSPLGTGPFAPAGTTAPNAGSPLIPLGPVSGATRVPPPATGSAAVNNAYIGNPVASSTGDPTNAGASDGGNFGTASGSLASGNPISGYPNSSNPPAAALSANSARGSAEQFRNSLGGMNVIDLTSQNTSLPPGSGYPPNPGYAGGPGYAASAGYADVANGALGAVGSGVASTQIASPAAFGLAQTPADRLRPIDQGFASAPGPMYRGMQGNGFQANASAPAVSAQPSIRGASIASSDTWQAPPPVVQATHSQATHSQAATSSLIPGPSTEPITHTATPTLPWRSPTTAR